MRYRAQRSIGIFAFNAASPAEVTQHLSQQNAIAMIDQIVRELIKDCLKDNG